MEPTGEELCNLGWQHQYGVGVEKNLRKAFEYYYKAAKLEDGDGLFWTGFCYNWGIGVDKDEQKAFVNYSRSAQAGNSIGIFKTAVCYRYGIGVEKNDSLYEIWIKKDYFLPKRYDRNLFQHHHRLGLFDGGFLNDLYQFEKMRDYFNGEENNLFQNHLYNSFLGNNKHFPNVIREYRHFDFSPLFDHNRFLRYDNNNLLPSRSLPPCYQYRSKPFRYDYVRNSDYGKCVNCNQNNTYKTWCQICDPDINTQWWTSKNKDIDNCIREFQLRATSYEDMIEWIPFNRLDNIKKIGEGGFGSVFSAIWLDGIRMIKGSKGNYMKIREVSTIALKTLPCNGDFLKEFKNHIQCAFFGSKLKIYGLTQNTSTNEYLMAFQYANGGNLYNFLKLNFNEITWESKLKQLKDVCKDLIFIHDAGYIHADLHPGNILQDNGEEIQSYISDLGLSKKANQDDSEGIYGVIPYIAPEVLVGQQFTKATDIYSFGVIMAEMSTGMRPFDGHEFDAELAIKIYNGLQPEFAHETPHCYVELAKQCMDSDPNKRPASYYILNKLNEWIEIMKSSDDLHIIKKQFLDADKIVKTLPINISKHPDHIYTSKFINTRKITEMLVKMKIDDVEKVFPSKLIDLEISEDIE